MTKPRHILLASHGTDGAREAEKLAYTFCEPGTILHHLVVVPDFWKGMQGDDWLNNASTRDAFGRHLESQLAQEIHALIERMRRETDERRIEYRHEMTQGNPVDCLIQRVALGPADLVVLGSPRPKGRLGLRSRMLDEKLFSALRVPVIIAPHPHG